jgi:hypothetical protein
MPGQQGSVLEAPGEAVAMDTLGEVSGIPFLFPSPPLEPLPPDVPQQQQLLGPV